MTTVGHPAGDRLPGATASSGAKEDGGRLLQSVAARTTDPALGPIAEAVRKVTLESQVTEEVYAQLLHEKVVDFLQEHAKIEDIAASAQA